MKKVSIFMMICLIGLSLSSCTPKTYDNLYEDYANYLVEQQDNYQAYITYLDEISSNSLKAVVHIESQFLYEGIQNNGSGAVIAEDDDFYYVLTNHHVISYNNDYPDKILISNYIDQTLNGHLMFYDASYDLALLSFDKTYELNIFHIDSHQVDEYERIGSISYPDDQNHAITMGFMIDYDQVSIAGNTLNQVDFDVLISNVPVKSGSSGSVVFNESFDLVGLVYAGRFFEDDSISTYTYAIPGFKIIEFLAAYEFEVIDDE